MLSKQEENTAGGERFHRVVTRRYVKYQENEERKEENQGRNFGLFEST